MRFMLELNNKIVKILLLALFTFVLGGSFCFSAIIKCFGIIAGSVGLAWLLLRGEKYDPIGLKIDPNLLLYLIRLIKEIFLSTASIITCAGFNA